MPRATARAKVAPAEIAPQQTATGHLIPLLDDKHSHVAHVSLNADSQVIVTANPDGSVTLVVDIDGAQRKLTFANPKSTALSRMLAKLDYYFQSLVEVFVTSTWSRKPPTQAGLYAIAARDGSFAGWVDHTPANDDRDEPARWVRYWPNRPTPYRMGQRPEDVHSGWWFTLPIPTPPNAPDWSFKGIE